MSVNDGESVNAQVHNDSVMDKNADTFTVGTVDLKNPQATSGGEITGAQRELNANKSYSGLPDDSVITVKPAWLDSSVGSATDSLKDRADAVTTQANTNKNDIAVNAGNITVNAGNIALNTQESADIRTTQGTANGDVALPPFTGMIIPDSSNVVGALQSLETAVEAIPAGLVFKGTWDANTNTPTLADGGVGGVAGDYYLVSVAGSTSLDGETDWDVNDWCVNIESTSWAKIDNSDQLGANQALSNLTNPTAINRDLLPNSSNRGIGGFSLGQYWNYVNQRQAIFYNNIDNAIRMVISGQPQVTPDGGSTQATMLGSSGEDMSVISQGTGGIDSGDIKIMSGNTDVSGNSGDIHLRPGVPDAGVRGSIKFEDGSEGTEGHVWTQKAGGDGSGEWLPGGGSGSGVGGKNYFLADAFNFEEGTTGTWQTYSDTPAFEPDDGVGTISTGTTEVDNTIAFNSVFNLPTTSRLTQKFVPLTGFDITKITLKDMSAAAAPASGSLFIDIHTDNAGEPSASPLYTSDAFDSSAITVNTYNPIDVTFPASTSLTASTDYWFVLRMATSTGGIVRSGINNDATDNYAAGVTAQSTDSGSTWNVDPYGGGEDLGFTVFSVGVPDVTFTAEQTSGIRDEWVGRLTNPGVDLQGQGISYSFVIDPADKNTDLYYSFDFLNLTALINNEQITFWVRDVTAGTNQRVIPKAGVDRFTARYSTSSNTDYRMIIHNSGTSASAYTVDVDTMIVGPTQILDFASDGPVGEIIQYGVDAIPANFIVADGVDKSRTDYPELFQAYGTAWGIGDGSTTFGIPNLTDRYLRGDGAGAVGDLQADATAVNGLTANQSQHRHLEGSHVWNGHTRTYGSVASAGDGPSGTGAGDQQAYTSWTDPAISVGSSDAETRPISAVVKMCIRFKSSRSGIITTTEALNEVSGARRKVDATGQSLPTGLTSAIDFQVDASPVTGNLQWQAGAGYNPGTGLWTTIPGYKINKTGWHNCEGNVTIEVLNAGKIQIASIMINGVAITANDYNEASTVGQASRSVSNNLYLNKGDVVSFGIFHNFGAARAVRSASTPGNYSWFSVLEHASLSTYGITGETEIIEVYSGEIPYPGVANTWGDLTSIDLTPGEWDIDLMMVIKNNGVATNATNAAFGLGTQSGTGVGGLTLGDTYRHLANPITSNGYWFGGVIPRINKVLTEDTTLYFKENRPLSVTNISVIYKITARRIK